MSPPTIRSMRRSRLWCANSTVVGRCAAPARSRPRDENGGFAAGRRASSRRPHRGRSRGVPAAAQTGWRGRDQVDEDDLAEGARVAHDEVGEEPCVVGFVEQVAADDEVEAAERGGLVGPPFPDEGDGCALVEVAIEDEEGAGCRVVVGGRDVGAAGAETNEAMPKPQPTSSTRRPATGWVTMWLASSVPASQTMPKRGQLDGETPSASAAPSGSLNCCRSRRVRRWMSCRPKTSVVKRKRSGAMGGPGCAKRSQASASPPRCNGASADGG